MTRPCCCALLAVALVSMAACEDEAGVQGHRGPCAAGAAGAFVGCEDAPIETSEDACWRLVECGVIPLVQNDPDLQWVTDWDECVSDLERLPEDRRAFVLDCIAAASCEDLLLNNSPTTPGGEPLCYEFGRIEGR